MGRNGWVSSVGQLSVGYLGCWAGDGLIASMSPAEAKLNMYSAGKFRPGIFCGNLLYVVVLWQFRHGRSPDGSGASATTATWPAVLHRGRP